MNQKLHSTLRMSAAGLAALTLASCSMPTSVAWQQIQRHGLIPFMMSDGAPLQTSSSSSQMLAHNNMPTTQRLLSTPRSYASIPATREPVTPRRLPAPPPPSMMNSAQMPVASAVADLPGYVRSPYTNPPRLVDVRGMNPGSKVVCPFTQKPFLVPGSVSTAPLSPKVAAAPRSEARPRTTPPVTPNTNVAALTKPTPAPAPPPPPVVTPTPQPKVEAKPSAPELPYGSSISGRPGFVNSPYAAKHQLVDVTGLPTGMEVKCPYTGKLFRVPPQ
jgi:hypothetical protein